MSKRVVLLSIMVMTGCASTDKSSVEAVETVDVETVRFTEEEPIDNELCLYGCPVGTPDDNIVVDHGILVLSVNQETKFADWVAYQVKAENLHGGTHTRYWRRDPDVPDDIAIIPEDYRGANAAYQYDRGHQAPLASFSNHPDWSKTNYLSNITPQKAALNQGQWGVIESRERTLAEEINSAYVITGPVFLEEMPELPEASIPHQVPSGYWKIIAIEDEDNHTTKVASFYLAQDTPRSGDYCEHSISLEEVEDLSGLTFFVGNSMIQMESLLPEIGC